MDSLAALLTALAAIVTAVTPWAHRVLEARSVERMFDYRHAVHVHRIYQPRPVRVQHDDGNWYPAQQDAWTQWPDDTWRASCSYSIASGMKCLRSVPAVKVRLPGR